MESRNHPGTTSPLAAVGKETRRRRPKDNIDLDMEDAERLGYGVHYGRFKADHPYTKDANEDRLYPKKKQKPQQEQQEKQRVCKIYENVCPVCGKKFTTPNRKRIYCDDVCKAKKDGKQWRRSHLTKQEVKI